MIASAALETARGGAATAGAAIAAAGARLYATPADPAYLAAERAVSNWRSEAAQDLEPMPLSAAVFLGAERPMVTRCVKLNNYWCIKRARWSGEIGFDEEGHVGFATAEHGADAAVNLLRRYYLDYGRKSALDIVRRWAPAECRTGPGVLSGVTAASLPGLALRGIGGTLRARWLASRRGLAMTARPARAEPRRGRLQAGHAGLARTAGAGREAVTPIPGDALASDTVQAPPPSATSAQASAKPIPQPAAPPRAPAGSATRAQGPPQRPEPRRVARAAPPARISVVPLRPLPSFRVPDIAAGMGERRTAAVAAGAGVLTLARRPAAARPKPVAARPTAVASAPRRKPGGPTPSRPAVLASVAPAAATLTPPLTPGAVPLAPRPILACAPDEQRHQNYAARMVQGLDLGHGDDLQLFEPNGVPRPNLARVLLSMSSVELGLLRAGFDLIEDAIERASAKAAEAAAGADDRELTP